MNRTPLAIPRVGINGWFWNTPDVGIGQYTRGLLYTLSNMECDWEIILITPDAIAPHDLPPSIHHHVYPVPHRFGALARIWFEQIGFPHICHKLDVDLIHVPYYGSPVRRGCPTVVTVHDIIPLILKPYKNHLLLRMYGLLIRRGLACADQIISVSEWTRRDVIQHLLIAPEEITAIHSAPAPHFKPCDALTKQIVREKYDLPDQYILYVGGYEFRKNVETLLAAYARTPHDFRQQYPLVLAGQLPSGNSSLLLDPRPLVTHYGLSDTFFMPGHIAEADIPAVYAAATVFIYLSHYEGFGLPVLEAMNCHTPVITANSTALPEIADNAAIIVDPTDTAAIAEMMIEMCTDESLRQAYILRGATHVQQFDWVTTAERTLTVYERALACATDEA